jgi:ABC-2 type transport system permease protein
MFSKALFKQSCKANGLMWIIITFAVCFMLACVMLISGSGNISKVKNSIEDTIITGEVDAAMESRSISYYKTDVDGLKEFDTLYRTNFLTVSTYNATFNAWLNAKPNRTDYSSDDEYGAALVTWQAQMPSYTNSDVEGLYVKSYNEWLSAEPKASEFNTTDEYNTAHTAWLSKAPNNTTACASYAYLVSINDLQTYEYNRAESINSSYTKDSNEAKEILGVVMYTINPNHTFDSFYVSHDESVPADYDITSIITHITDENYLTSDERISYVEEKSKSGCSIFLAGNMTSEDNVQLLLEKLSKFGVTKEKYDSFGYTYDSIKHTSYTSIISYQNRYDYELSLINDKNAKGEYKTTDDYNNAILSMDKKLVGDISDSLLASLPTEVSNALQEVGQMDLYSLIIGSIFYKMAGLLLPIIYMIMASNNLIAGQVDSGSMAYVLSTSTKRKQVVFTQGLFLVGSIFLMFCCTSLTSVVCLAILNDAEIKLTYGKLLLLNLGAFVTLFAMSGICFFASCYFDRSKRAMSVGGGLSMFFLVATMLGLFGSKVIPSVVRLDALNNFNYVSLITLFDSISIIDGTTTFLWKFAILLGIGLLGYILGGIKFVKKDLPL